MITQFFASISGFVFCHWQLPTYNGTKSYQNLLVGVYGMAISNRTNYDIEIQRDPLNFIRSGYYNYGSGGITGRSNGGRHWESETGSAVDARGLYFSYTALYLQYNFSKSLGFTLRCLVR